MKKLLFLTFILLTFSFQSCMKRIDAGHTGIKFNLYGVTDEKGVSDKEMVSGAVWYNPITRQVFEYPHFWQDVEYEEVSFNSIEGEPITSDLKIIFRYVKENISGVFDEYRLSPQELRNTVIQSIVLEQLSTQAGKLSAVDIMGNSRETLLTNVLKSLNENYKGVFEFQLVSFTSELVPSDNVQNAIQGVIQAQEKAKAAEAHTIEVKEAALQRVINARADSTALVVKAAGEARAIQLVQDQLSSNPRYIDYIKAKNWDGKLPQVQGSATPFIEIK